MNVSFSVFHTTHTQEHLGEHEHLERTQSIFFTRSVTWVIKSGQKCVLNNNPEFKPEFLHFGGISVLSNICPYCE